MIQAHLYVKNANTPVYSVPEVTSNPIHLLGKGNWVGVLEHVGQWVRIAGVLCVGWVKLSELENRPPLELHIHQVSTNTIEYLNA